MNIAGTVIQALLSVLVLMIIRKTKKNLAKQGQREVIQEKEQAKKQASQTYIVGQTLQRTGRSMTSMGRPTQTVTRYQPKSGKATANVEKVGGLFSKLNSGFDKYPETKVSTKRRKKDLTIADSMTYSHIYDGHELWDDCMPKEKDPWDKGFYDDEE